MSCEHLLEAHGSLLTAPNVQVCDATGDAMSKGLLRRNTKARYKKIILHFSN
jgi:hypothetical protein